MYYDFKSAEKSLEKEFDRINDIRDFNQRKVLEAFFENKVAIIIKLTVFIDLFKNYHLFIFIFQVLFK